MPTAYRICKILSLFDRTMSIEAQERKMKKKASVFWDLNQQKKGKQGQ